MLARGSRQQHRKHSTCNMTFEHKYTRRRNMGKKKFLERISDALGLYDPDDPNREMDEEEDDEEEEEVVEKPAKRGFPKAVRQAPVPVAKEEPESVPADKEAKGKSRVCCHGCGKAKRKPYNSDEDNDRGPGSSH